MDDLYQQIKLFFAQSPEEKMKVAVDENFRGYTPLNEETLDPKVQKQGDTKEGYYIGRHVDPDSEEAKLPLHGPNQFPDLQVLPEFQKITVAYFDAMSKLAYDVAQVFGQAVGAPDGFFAQPGVLDKPMAALRLLHYAAEKSDLDRGIFGAGAHTDYGLITLLSTDENAGLEIEYQNEWVPVPVRRDAFIVNIGDMAERWTNDRCRSTKHRVVNRLGVERYSVPFFYEPNFTCQVQVFPSCLTQDQPVPKYPVTTSGEHLMSKYRQTHADFAL